MKFLKYAALLVALCFASPAWAVCGSGAGGCFWIAGTGTMDFATDTLHWSSSSGGASCTPCEPISTSPLTFDANSGVAGATFTVTPNATVNVASFTMGACTGTTTGCIIDFSANNNNVTIGSGGFSASGTGTRTLKMGSGTWTIAGTSSTWNIGTTTNLTFNAGTSVLSFTGNLTTFANIPFGSSLTYATVNFGAQTGGFGFGITASGSTFGAIGITAPNFIDFTTALTITNAFTWAGSSASSTISLLGNNATLTVSGSSTISWAALQGMKFSTSVTATNSFDAGGNTNASISGPSGAGGGFIIGG